MMRLLIFFLRRAFFLFEVKVYKKDNFLRFLVIIYNSYFRASYHRASYLLNRKKSLTFD